MLSYLHQVDRTYAQPWRTAFCLFFRRLSASFRKGGFNTITTTSKPPSARPEDYIEIQGGVPSIEKQGKLSVVIHDYEGGDGMEVRGKNIKKYGTVDLTLSNGEVRRFQVGLLRQFHDEPCEGQSRRLGGEGYDRR